MRENFLLSKISSFFGMRKAKKKYETKSILMIIKTAPGGS
jgi:hypothetical protein